MDVDFHRACASGAPAQNNLGGLGPDTGAQEIRYANVGTVYGMTVDLVVTAVSPYTSSKAQIRNGCKESGTYGVIHVDEGQSVELEFSLQTPAGAPVPLRAFQFTFLDMDNFLNNQAIESVRVNGHSTYRLSNPTNVSVTGDVFSSTTWGVGADNPLDPLTLTEEQRRKSVAFLFENTNAFTATLAVTNGGIGRNFFFAGRSNVPPECARPPPSPPLPAPPPPPVVPPAPPGVAYVKEITFTTVVAGTVETFDSAAYKSNVASAVNVPESDVTVTATAASVLVKTDIKAQNDNAAAAIVTTLSASSEALSTLLGVNVTSVQPIVTRDVAVTSTTPSTGGATIVPILNVTTIVETAPQNLESGASSDGVTDSEANVAILALSIVCGLLILVLLICCAVSRQQWRLQLRRADRPLSPQGTGDSDPYADMVKESWARTTPADTTAPEKPTSFWRRLNWRLQVRRAPSSSQQAKSRDDPAGYSDIVVDSWAHAIVSQPSSSALPDPSPSGLTPRGGDADATHEEPDWLQDAHATAFAGPPAGAQAGVP